MRVKATQEGYYGLSIRNIGEEFDVEEKKFSEIWMVIVDKPKKNNVASKSNLENIQPPQEIEEVVIVNEEKPAEKENKWKSFQFGKSKKSKKNKR